MNPQVRLLVLAAAVAGLWSLSYLARLAIPQPAAGTLAAAALAVDGMCLAVTWLAGLLIVCAVILVPAVRLRPIPRPVQDDRG